MLLRMTINSHVSYGSHQIGHCHRSSRSRHRGGMHQCYHSRHTVQTARNGLYSRTFRRAQNGHTRIYHVVSHLELIPLLGAACIMHRAEDGTEGGTEGAWGAAMKLAIRRSPTARGTWSGAGMAPLARAAAHPDRGQGAAYATSKRSWYRLDRGARGWHD